MPLPPNAVTAPPAYGTIARHARPEPRRPASAPPASLVAPAEGALPTVTLAALLALAVASGAALIWQVASPQPVRFAGMTIDRLSAALTLLVAAIGAVTYRFSVRYLDGDPARGRFLGWMAFTVICADVLMLSSHFLVLMVAWSLTSLGLDRLLIHYRHRPEAVRAARKKFLISRLGDVALVAAAAVAWWSWGTLDIPLVIERATADPAGGASSAVSVLVVIAALTKSAQVPFHSWLPETMESPTPVSALMHAGIINAGGALLLRLAPLVAQAPSALLILTAVGTLTATLGIVAMWAQVKVKRTLAWSTVSQMGFMMVQCGLGAFGAAALHIVAHGCYKAWSFLRSGQLPPVTGATAPIAPMRALTMVAAGTVIAIPAIWVASRLVGFAPLHTPGELALTCIVALSAGQLWGGIVARGARPVARAGVATLVAWVGVGAAIVLYRGAQTFLAPVIGPIPVSGGAIGWITAAIPVMALVGLTVLHAALPQLARTPRGRALRVHALHGFYGGVVADRVVDSVWKRFSPQGAHHA